ncbi:MAG: rhodanese-like domain-containing protein [Candidatus Caldarchaeum sp.]|nr:rhodanese-like domain-containing protein [Candidatus Caldarchaeum sp.]
MKPAQVLVVGVVVALLAGFAAGAVASPGLFPVQTPTVTTTVLRTLERTVDRTVTATVTVEKTAAVDEMSIIYRAVDAYINNIPVGKWYFYEIKDLKELIDRGEKVFILDVREKAEWDAGYIPGAVHIRLTELTDNLDKLPKDKNALIVAYCKVGIRCAMAITALRILGYTNIWNLRGGMDAWVAAGYPVAKS